MSRTPKTFFVLTQQTSEQLARVFMFSMSRMKCRAFEFDEPPA